jgi:carbon monoxide dehydrogenase subunit G
VRIENRFTVSLPIAAAWKVLLDVERIARCVPGGELADVTGDECRGRLRVALGAVPSEYAGVVRFVDVDEGSYRMVLEGHGREAGGEGAARATVTAALRQIGVRTEVALDADVTLTGPVARLERDVLAGVASSLLARFAERLEADLAREGVQGADVPAGYQAADDDAAPAKRTRKAAKAIKATKAAKKATRAAKRPTRATKATSATPGRATKATAGKATRAAKRATKAPTATKAGSAHKAAKSAKSAKSAVTEATEPAPSATKAADRAGAGGRDRLEDAPAAASEAAEETTPSEEAEARPVAAAALPEVRRALADVVAVPSRTPEARPVPSTAASFDVVGRAGGPLAERALPAGAIAAIVVMILARRRGIRALFGLVAAALVAALTQAVRSRSR